MDSEDSDSQNPIFNIMKLEQENSNLNENMMMPNIIPPPFISNRNKKKYSNENIDKMKLALNDFQNNIMQMMEITNRMNIIIDKYNENTIYMNIVYKSNRNNITRCKLDDKLSDVLSKINFREENFNINDKLVIFSGRRLDLNKTIREENIYNGSFVFIIDK